MFALVEVRSYRRLSKHRGAALDGPSGLVACPAA